MRVLHVGSLLASMTVGIVDNKYADIAPLHTVMPDFLCGPKATRQLPDRCDIMP